MSQHIINMYFEFADVVVKEYFLLIYCHFSLVSTFIQTFKYQLYLSGMQTVITEHSQLTYK